MSTYSDMQARIADEMARTDLTNQIQLAILSAINFYKDERFWFNEGEVTFNTIIGLDHQIVPTTFGEVDEITVTVSGNRYVMDLVSYDYIRVQVSQQTLMGQPERAAIFEEDIWYDPIPDRVYPIILSGLIYFATLSGASDSNVWTNEAESLIRCRAKSILYTHVTRNDKMAAAMDARESRHLAKLRQKTVQRTAASKLKAMRF